MAAGRLGLLWLADMGAPYRIFPGSSILPSMLPRAPHVNQLLVEASDLPVYFPPYSAERRASVSFPNRCRTHLGLSVGLWHFPNCTGPVRDFGAERAADSTSGWQPKSRNGAVSGSVHGVALPIRYGGLIQPPYTVHGRPLACSPLIVPALRTHHQPRGTLLRFPFTPNQEADGGFRFQDRIPGRLASSSGKSYVAVAWTESSGPRAHQVT